MKKFAYDPNNETDFYARLINWAIELKKINPNLTIRECLDEIVNGLEEHFDR